MESSKHYRWRVLPQIGALMTVRLISAALLNISRPDADATTPEVAPKGGERGIAALPFHAPEGAPCPASGGLIVGFGPACLRNVRPQTQLGYELFDSVVLVAFCENDRFDFH